MYFSNDTKWSSLVATTTAAAGPLDHDVADLDTGERHTDEDKYIIYGLLGGLLVTVLFLVALAAAVHAIKKRLLVTRKRSATTGTTRANSWVMLCHEKHQAAAGGAGGVFPSQAEPVAQGTLPFVVPTTRRQGSQRPSLSTFISRPSNVDDVGTTPNAAGGRSVPKFVVEEETAL